MDLPLRRALCVALAAFVLGACGDGPAGPALADSVELGAPAPSIMVGELARLSAVVKDASGTVLTSRVVTWSSNNPAVARVTASGLVTAVAAGTASITATADGKSTAAEVVVRPIAWRALAGAVDNTCGVSTSGVLYCWGGARADLFPASSANGTCRAMFTSSYSLPCSSRPVKVAATSEIVVKDVLVGDNHTCVLDTAGKAYCWGTNEYGQLGNGQFGGAVPTATAVATTRTYDSFVQYSNANHVCARTEGGQVDCWGRVTVENPVNRPTPVEGGRSLKVFMSSSETSCLAAEDGKPYCWGRNDFGQLGNGTTAFAAAPVPVATSELVADIAVNGFRTCLVTRDGRLFCWGSMPEGRQRTPALVETPARFAKLVHGGSANCALTAAGEAYCWGSTNHEGHLGDGTTQGHMTPAPVAGNLRFTSAVIGWWQVCGIATSGSAYCWGPNTAGQGGNGTTENTLVPTLVADPIVS